MNNILTLIGNVGQEPQVIHSTRSENTLVTFDIAVDEGKDKDPLWVKVEAWNGLGERVVGMVKKGREVMVTGRLGIVSYEKDGVKIEKAKALLKLNGFHLCDARSRNTQETATAPAPASAPDEPDNNDAESESSATAESHPVNAPFDASPSPAIADISAATTRRRGRPKLAQ